MILIIIIGMLIAGAILLIAAEESNSCIDPSDNVYPIIQGTIFVVLYIVAALLISTL